MAIKKPLTLLRTIGYILAIGGVIGFLAAFILTVDKIKLIEDPSFVPSCNINPIISCGSVMKTPQSAVFGFPNSLIGLASFAIVATVGMALLAGATFKRWFWLGLQAGTIFGVVFVHWLFFQTVYRIGALCPFCMVVWSVTIPIFWYTLLYNLRAGHIKAPTALKSVVNFVTKHHGDILIIWFLVLAGLILNHFWYYWSTIL